MRKTIARALIVVSAFTGLSFVVGQPAAAHHSGGHHCRWPNGQHRHSKEFYQKLREERRNARQQGFDNVADERSQEIHTHRHHSHTCRGRTYPPR